MIGMRNMRWPIGAHLARMGRGPAKDRTESLRNQLMDIMAGRQANAPGPNETDWREIHLDEMIYMEKGPSPDAGHIAENFTGSD